MGLRGPSTMVLWVAEARKGSHHVNVQPRCDGLHEVRFLKRKEQPLQKCDGDSTHVFRMLLILQHFIFLKLVCNSVGSGKFRIGWLRESVRENQTAQRHIKTIAPRKIQNQLQGSCSTTRNWYLFIIIEKYSRFRFAFPYLNMTFSTVIRRFCKMIPLFEGLVIYGKATNQSPFSSQKVLHGHKTHSQWNMIQAPCGLKKQLMGLGTKNSDIFSTCLHIVGYCAAN